MTTDYATIEYPYRGYRIVSRWDHGHSSGGIGFQAGWYADAFRGSGACDASFCHAVRAHTIVAAEEFVDAALAEATEKLIESL